MVFPPQSIHPTDEGLTVTKITLVAALEAVDVDTFDGKLHTRWGFQRALRRWANLSMSGNGHS